MYNVQLGNLQGGDVIVCTKPDGYTASNRIYDWLEGRW